MSVLRKHNGVSRKFSSVSRKQKSVSRKHSGVSRKRARLGAERRDRERHGARRRLGEFGLLVRRGNILHGFYLKGKAGILPWLSYMCHFT